MKNNFLPQKISSWIESKSQNETQMHLEEWIYIDQIMLQTHL